jgi:serine/threonine protein kinase/formylglycine-generating enzyme required for sulfatase activity
MKTCPQCGKLYDNTIAVCPNDDASLIETTPTSFIPSEGSLLAGRYRIVEKIGEGGMGAIYKAVHTMMDRTCAIKLLTNLSSNDESSLARFNREAKMASRISNPHAVTIYDFGAAEGGTLYLAMEFIDGQPLSKILEDEKTLPVARVVRIVEQIGAALRAAHELEIVHRDLKPDNIMICNRSEGDYVKVLDFGIAKTVADDSADNLTKTGFILGTPVYMSPEQLSGDRLDARSDVYSLALIAYQMLSGRLPFEGDNPQAIMVKRLMTDPIPLAVAEPSVGDSIERAVMSGLVRDRDGRTPTAQQFAKELTDALMSGTQVMGSRSTSKLEDQGRTAPDPDPSSYRTRPETLADQTGVRGSIAPFASPSLPAASIQPTGSIQPSITVDRSAAAASSIRLAQARGEALPSVQQKLNPQQQIEGAPPRRSSLKLWLPVIVAILALSAAGLFFMLRPAGFTLRVTGAPPGSKVSINSVHRGETSPDGTLSIPGLDEGELAVRISYPGYTDFSTTLNGENGKEESIAAEMLQTEIDYNGKMVLVPAGEFTMGNDDRPEEGPAHTVHLPAFYIDKFEVTNRQYKEFRVDKGLASKPANPNAFPDYFDRYPDSPVVGMSWHDAAAFAGSVGKQLPSEEQWEKAASWDPSTKKKRKWPWGDTPEIGRANLGVNSRGPSGVDQFSRDVSAYGVIGMAGNAGEWVDGIYKPYKNSTASDRKFDEDYRIVRGGFVVFRDLDDARTTRRHPQKAEDKDHVRAIGLRCVVLADDPKIQDRVRGRTK